MNLYNQTLLKTVLIFILQPINVIFVKILNFPSFISYSDTWVNNNIVRGLFLLQILRFLTLVSHYFISLSKPGSHFPHLLYTYQWSNQKPCELRCISAYLYFIGCNLNFYSHVLSLFQLFTQCNVISAISILFSNSEGFT